VLSSPTAWPGKKGAVLNPKNLRYHKEHDWALIDGETAVFGITHYAQEQLGDIVYIELPEVGSEVTKDSAYAEIESVKAVSDVYAPLSGTILEVNDDAVDAPETLNESPYDEGWLIKVKLSDPGEIDDLMSVDEYEQMLAEEEE
jgi:glycine cleavage system H protein